jgi:hypothetical protein
VTRNEARRVRANIEKTATFADDQTALESVWMYPAWHPGMVCESGKRVVYGGKLYRVNDGQGHTAQADWAPDTAVTLFTRIDETHAGTAGDPIPYDGNMELIEGKYYSQGGAVYLCIRSTGTAVYHALSDLVGLYVETV